MKIDNTEIKQTPLKPGNTEIKRGGKRAGAGRKPLPPDQRRVSITIRLSREYFDRLVFVAKECQHSKTKVIEKCIKTLQLNTEIKRRGPRRSKLPAGEIIDV